MSAEKAGIDRIPQTAAGKQLAWYLDLLASASEGGAAPDPARWVPERIRQWGSGSEDERRNNWRAFSENIGAFEVASVDEASEFAVTVTLKAAKDRQWRVTCRLEERPPHRIDTVNWQRVLDHNVVARAATEADGAALADIERRCPIVLGDKSVTIDRGEDYFAFSRLMDDPAVGIALVDGAPAAAICWALHRVRVAGVEHPIVTGVHLRVLPEHQRKGLWGAANNILEKYAGKYDASRAIVSIDNAAMLHGFRNSPAKWNVLAMRAQLACASIAGPRAGRPATANDAPRIVEILNACHDSEEMYLPYTVESLTARVQRAPKQYSWERVWLTDHAMVGVWPAGDTIRYVIESRGRRTESRRGLVADYGFLPGAEAELESLLRAWCGWLAERGADTLSIFTSEKSPGYAMLCGLAREVESFRTFMPGLPEPPGASERGLYTDAIYF
jgi:hypothetical protein